jgi:thioredoxin reductase
VVGLTGQAGPGDYDVVVVGSGPGGLQTAYCLQRLGIEHAVISADEAPGGMFRFWPIFGRLLSWSKPDAPYEPTSREYEWHDHNSLLADDPELRALVPRQMDRSFAVPTREEMVAGHAEFAARAGLEVRYGCRWEATRREPDGRLVLITTAGEYRCRAAVFAIGVTEPWRSPIPGIEAVPHYADTREASSYRDRRVFVIGKRNSGFELADGLLPWARQLVVASPSPVRAEVLALSTVRVRYFQPLEDSVVGGGTIALDAAIESIERTGNGFRIRAQGTTQPGELLFEPDDVIAATGFRAPLLDLPELGVVTVAQGRVPALTPFFESTSAPGIFFAGNATQGAAGLRREGVVSTSAAVQGFRYNARILAEHLAERLGRPRTRPRVDARELPALLGRALARSPELWAQKGYLARAFSLEEAADEGVVPLEHFVDASGPDGAAVTVELDGGGRIFPAVYLRRGGKLRIERLDPHPLHAFDGEPYRRSLARLLDVT